MRKNKYTDKQIVKILSSLKTVHQSLKLCEPKALVKTHITSGNRSLMAWAAVTLKS